ncbi:ABC transporter ATP-binding protein [Gordonia rubripertincta]|uniref:ABC transporter ATP-binding protein n=2 Tax=Gordonia rubripertincta TaxID=36822 RepID=A0AAW6R6N5_GORRU|nr:ABC transporter ATP-binding protein [Gordonia rubripertincta]MDG6780050.1 ABC transporter ATP-binding protein [Gordonia rubripertincta]NKY65256.1 ABC transporter ATP-binding protein [Gordonia rubripertincta]GAB84654.1 putative ABC transporter permease/ATP-binding protein [Gordonia rubripertincta NBRC 101908]
MIPEPTAPPATGGTPTTSPGWIRKLLGEAWRYRRIVIVTLTVTMIAVGVDVVMPLLAKGAIDRATGVIDDDLALSTIITGLVVLAFVRYACHFGRRVFAGRLAVNVQNNLRRRLLDTLLHLDGRSQHQIRTGQIVSRSISDIQVVQGLLAMAPLSLGAAVQMVVALGVMAYLSPLLTAVALVIAPLIALEVFRTRRKLFAATWSAQQAAADVAQHVEETVTGVRVVKGFGQEDRAVDGLVTRCRTLFARRLRAARINARFAPTLSAIPQLGMVGVIVVGGYLTLTDTITAGTFLAFTTYVTAMTGIARLLTNLIVNAHLARAAVERVYDVIDHPRDPGETATGTLPDGPLGVELENVSFAHHTHDADDPPAVLTGIDLRIEPGECVAIVGPPGSGKSTIADLVSRFERPDAGTISLVGADGPHPVDSLSPTALHEAVAAVFDEPFLFSDTITANIAMGPGATADPASLADRVRAAAAAAEATEFIEALPDGYDTVVGERGLTLSGGQRQRIALARALFADPRVLVLDDATSAVDATTEARILGRLRDQKRTMLVLAHRRSTLVLADRVAVLDDGRITAIGTTAELEASSARFRALMTNAVGDPHDAGATPAGASISDDTIEDLWPTTLLLKDQAYTRTGTPVGAGTRTGQRGGGVASALGSMPATPELQARVDALPPAVEDPDVDVTDARRENPRFTLRGLLRPVRWLLAFALLAIAVDTLVGLAFPSIARAVIDAAGDHDQRTLWWAAIGGVALVGVGWVAASLLTMTSTRAGERVLFGLRIRSYAHIQRLGLDYYERELSGRIMTRMTTDIDALSTFLQTGLTSAIVALLTLVGVTVALLVTGPLLALLVLPVFPLLVVATVVFRRVASAAYTRSRELISTVNADFQENIAGIKTTQTYLRTDDAQKRFGERSAAWVAARMVSQRAIASYFPLIMLMSDVATAIALGVGAGQVADGSLTAGTLVAFVLYLTMLFGPVQQLSQVFDGYQQAAVGLRRIGDLLRTPSSLRVNPDATAPPATGFDGEVDFDGVGFRYQGAESDALNDVDLHIPAGSSLALVGRTGAGKSTIVKLLARFYDPTTGRVLVDGTDIGDLVLSGYRSRLGLVPQEPHLFTGTVADNIAYGRPDADRAAIVDAAAAVGALPMIAALPGRMNHPIGERGQGLSSGQRQLIALARAELVDPDLLLLDEATATLDQATEAQVLAAGRAMTRRRTSVIVAHRLATAARADMIAVVDGGRIVELGTHDELLALHSLYRGFWEAGVDPDEAAVTEPGETVPAARTHAVDADPHAGSRQDARRGASATDNQTIRAGSPEMTI